MSCGAVCQLPKGHRGLHVEFEGVVSDREVRTDVEWLCRVHHSQAHREMAA